ncbi:alpha/beta fold hydrolase [Flavobacterium selenitireducens]|uniref:alpha/beta fold hydrolase n=1 Tax=Flavobacterium selenitireducens TaxID=2722704 RepID=UPI00168B2DBB|nr:alpha/beta hydrolase [Flavobacterium selenitireducens]MBD3582122.1 alpha/beta hydrolase [Flavobacterium selenitireducens]
MPNKRKKIVALLLLLSGIASSQKQGFARSGDGTPIFYRTFGSGKPLLIINGGPGMNSNGFEELAQNLGKNNLVILYDQRGTGKSTLKNPTAKNMTMDLLVDDIDRLRKKLGFDSWIVLGHSFGGMLGSYYTSLHPTRVDKLILSSSGGIDLELLNHRDLIRSKLDKTQRDSLAYWESKIDNGDTTYTTSLGRGRALAPAYVVQPKFHAVLAKRLTQGNRRINTLIWQDLNRMHFDCAPKLRNFEKPVLIIQGKQDIVPHEIAEKAHRVLKNSRVVLLENCSHYGWLDAENAYFSEVGNFLKS